MTFSGARPTPPSSEMSPQGGGSRWVCVMHVRQGETHIPKYIMSHR